MIDKCCKQYNIGCGISVSFVSVWNLPNPVEGSYLRYDVKDRSLKQLNVDFSSVNVILTELQFTRGNVLGVGFAGSGAFLYFSEIDPENVLDDTFPHEVGHVAGYDGGDRDFGRHSSSPANVMYPFKSVNSMPDKCWCEKVARYAK